MKKIIFLLFSFLSLSSFGQNLEWIPFNWHGDSIYGKYYDKLAILIPVTIENFPHKFNMQLDFGATKTQIYGNSMKPFPKEYNELKSKIDTSLTYWLEYKKYYMFKNINFKIGKVSIGEINIVHHNDYGDSITKNSINTIHEIGTTGTDIFQDKFVIIDYPNKRICITTELPKQYAKATFQPFVSEDGRVKIPLNIDGKTEYLMFDTGSSIFSLATSKKNAEIISDRIVVDSLIGESWGRTIKLLGLKTNKQVKFGNKILKPTIVYYETTSLFDVFFNQQKIWGITGNAYFFNDVVIIDYKNKRFGVK